MEPRQVMDDKLRNIEEGIDILKSNLESLLRQTQELRIDVYALTPESELVYEDEARCGKCGGIDARLNMLNVGSEWYCENCR